MSFTKYTMRALPNIERYEIPYDEDDTMSLVRYLRHQPVGEKYKFIMRKNRHGNWNGITVEDKSSYVVQNYGSGGSLYLDKSTNMISESCEDWEEYTDSSISLGVRCRIFLNSLPDDDRAVKVRDYYFAYINSREQLASVWAQIIGAEKCEFATNEHNITSCVPQIEGKLDHSQEFWLAPHAQFPLLFRYGQDWVDPILYYFAYANDRNLINVLLEDEVGTCITENPTTVEA